MSAGEHLHSDFDFQLTREIQFNKSYLAWLSDYSERLRKIEAESTVATGRPNFAPIILHAVEMKVFLDRVDRLGYDYVYLGYHCMFDAEGRYQVIDYRSKAGEELVRLGDDFTRPIPSNYGFPEYVGARTLDSCLLYTSPSPRD